MLDTASTLAWHRFWFRSLQIVELRMVTYYGNCAAFALLTVRGPVMLAGLISTPQVGTYSVMALWFRFS